MATSFIEMPKSYILTSLTSTSGSWNGFRTVTISFTYYWAGIKHSTQFDRICYSSFLLHLFIHRGALGTKQFEARKNGKLLCYFCAKINLHLNGLLVGCIRARPARILLLHHTYVRNRRSNGCRVFMCFSALKPYSTVGLSGIKAVTVLFVFTIS